MFCWIHGCVCVCGPHTLPGRAAHPVMWGHARESITQPAIGSCMGVCPCYSGACLHVCWVCIWGATTKEGRAFAPSSCNRNLLFGVCWGNTQTTAWQPRMQAVPQLPSITHADTLCSSVMRTMLQLSTTSQCMHVHSLLAAWPSVGCSDDTCSPDITCVTLDPLCHPCLFTICVSVLHLAAAATAVDCCVWFVQPRCVIIISCSHPPPCELLCSLLLLAACVCGDQLDWVDLVAFPLPSF
jgi:hypothetical protein